MTPELTAQMTTELEWEDLILPLGALDQLEKLVTSVLDAETLEDIAPELASHGLNALFHGPPGTGKTLAATLIGQRVGRPVLRIDLSMMVSRYIGETEKNVAQIFDEATEQNWVLFFDEADALFGKRTQISTSNDRHANQEVSYLLQRIEEFSGLLILASNLRSNIDEAFVRRFQTVIPFTMPNVGQRLRLWERAMRRIKPGASSVDLEELAEKYEITSGDIIRAVEVAARKALTQRKEIGMDHILDALK